MAKVTFTAFIEDLIRNQSGEVFALKTSEPHRRQVDGTWVTEARTYRDVKAPRDGVNLSAWQKGDRVTVTGTEKTEKRVTPDKNFYTLIVWADSITRQGETPPPAAEPTPPEDPWATPQTEWATTPIPDEVPF